jgi:glycine/D-amino acid oxidase-like deaminating enzyme
VILAAGAATGAFADAAYLEVAAVQGQLDVVDVDAPPRMPLVGSRYLVPVAGGLAAGSTYEHRPWDPDHASRSNLQQLQGVRHSWRERHRGTRCVSSDRSPIAGPLYGVDGMAVAGRYVSTGHGSAGNVSAHLAGALLCDWIRGDCPPLARPVEAVLSPWRFRERQARRGIRHLQKGAEG